jgi:hypothetical protein
MFVHIKGVQRENFSGVWRAGRFWPSAAALRVEVVKDEPAKIVEDLTENGKKVGTREVFDMKRIGKETYEALRLDGRITVFQDGETDSVISQAVLDAARKGKSAADERIVALEAEITALKEANESLAARLVELEPKQHHEGKGGKKS